MLKLKKIFNKYIIKILTYSNFMKKIKNSCFFLFIIPNIKNDIFDNWVNFINGIIEQFNVTIRKKKKRKLLNILKVRFFKHVSF